MTTLILFLSGTAIGSFINVLSIRYRPDRKIFDKKIIGGRSHCPGCKKKLNWYELIPIFSFVVQLGRCRKCKTRLSFQYPLVEILSGLIFVFIPLQIADTYKVSFLSLGGALPLWYYLVSGIFLLFAFTLILISAIDFRLKIIPDQSNLLIVFLGILLIFVSLNYGLVGDSQNSFLGFYALLFGFQDNIWLNRITASLIGLFFLGIIAFLSRGKGMGLGDVKLAGAAGLILGWPDAILALFLAFIVGALWSIILIIKGSRTLKSSVPFGPFMAIGFFLVIFFGMDLMLGYFALFP